MRVVFALVYLLAIALLAHPVGEAIPGTAFHPERFPFCGCPWETRLYRLLRVAKWKDKVPDMSKRLSDMQPKKLLSVSVDQMDALLCEMCRAESVHWAEVLLGIGCVFIAPGIGWVLFAVWALLGNLPFILIQRYNRPRILVLKNRLARARQKGA